MVTAADEAGTATRAVIRSLARAAAVFSSTITIAFMRGQMSWSARNEGVSSRTQLR